ncbi:hypothetical protein [Archaeoglobus profundus]|uniref:Uncharacterized protein n=1 Tax=Archaeoglobus profundus (strain DSM 5631 / JCM 9629 / NBRC 100127 / Av18) TaxID=572546 RepID=D2REG7_ARCPA|nr:hypothetical protein [Archaeoglobus profundus]ADB58511.1 hypothetical protein Arcpr_1464 [Archaeoglobus profundus DSM 5631]
MVYDAVSALLGLVAVALSAVTYSSLGSSIDARLISPEDLIVFIFLLFHRRLV